MSHTDWSVHEREKAVFSARQNTSYLYGFLHWTTESPVVMEEL